MTDYRPSIVEYYSKSLNRHCGYCSSEGSVSYGLTAHTLKVEDYQNMIDRGWRRSGKYCYKAVMDSTCCPLYTIRCAVKDFRLSKSQKKILKRFNNFLINGTVTSSKMPRATDMSRSMEIYHPQDEKKSASNADLTLSSVDASVNDRENLGKLNQDRKNEEYHEVKPKNDVTVTKGEANKKCRKAKQLRIERKRQKLQKLGLSEEEIAKKLVEKKRYPVTKTIEDYLNEPSSKNQVHNLNIFLVRSSPRSDEFENTFAITFDLYKRYQTSIHKDPPEKLTENQFERFLVISPLQIKLVLVKSSEFKKTYKESALLFCKYQKVIHNDNTDVKTFYDFLVNSPLQASKEYGSYHQQYWLDNKLIAVGVIDILPRCVSSVYFFYDPDYAHLSLGTYAALREVEFARRLSSRLPDLVYYYMGFYIHSCVKMKYKGAFKPSFLLCPEAYTWHSIKECLPKLETSKYSWFNEDIQAKDNSDVHHSEVLILYNNMAMALTSYLRQKNCDWEEIQEIMEYAKLVGKSCSKNMLLFRP